MKTQLLPQPRPGKIPRYCPEIELPNYRFLPGFNAHPYRDPSGHSYGKELSDDLCYPLNPTNWDEHLGYLYGVDLFNHAYWWECHEWWEGIWKCTEDLQTKAYLQSLIQLGAALLNACLGPFKDQAIKNLLRDIENRLSNIPNPYLGCEHAELLKQTKLALRPCLEGHCPEGSLPWQLSHRISTDETPLMILGFDASDSPQSNQCDD